MWYRRAAESRNIAGAAEARTAIEQDMSAEQLSQARELAKSRIRG